MKQLYADYALNRVHRIISDLNKNPLSSTYGCFDREYWHFKTIDFPNGNRQMSVLALALLYKYPFKNNTFYQQRNLHDWVIAGINFASRSSHKDGSCDEFFPNERTFFSTSATLYCFVECVLELRLQDVSILNFLKKRANWVMNHTEDANISNHHAVAALSLLKCYTLFEEKRYLESALEHLRKTLFLQDEEGWFREYEGCDPGYLLLTIDYLAKFNKLYHLDELEKCLLKAFRFASNFYHPDGSYGGEYGSRNTSSYFPAGIEILAQEFHEVIPFANLFLHGLKKKHVSFSDSDRHYYVFINLYLQAYLACSRGDFEILPSFSDDCSYYPNAGLLRVAINNNLLICAVNKGGVYKIFNEKGAYAAGTGYIARLNDGGLITTNSISQSYTVDRDGNSLSVNAPFFRLQEITPSQFTYILFRLLCLVKSLGTPIKKILVNKTILQKQELGLWLRRKFSWEQEKIFIEDEIYGDKKLMSRIERLLEGPDLTTIHVPGSRYYYVSDLLEWNIYFITDNNKNKFIRKEISLVKNDIILS